MSDKLVEFAIALDQDPTLQKRYTTNPEKTLKEFGVEDNDVSLLMGDDLSAIKERLALSGLHAILNISKPK